ncbi:MAG: TonB-dependent receptor [Alistipes sp.]|nr:TonB-dependent receptor [Alistipes sp.]
MIQKVEAGSDYRFSWSGNLPNDISISVPSGAHTVEELLSAALRNKGVEYVIKQNDIVLLPQQKAAQAAPAASQSKERTITGTVVDAETGAPVIGASVWIKDSTIGTTVDIDGNFSLKAPNNLAVMAVSFIGYEDYEVAINSITSHTTIKLKTSTTVMEDVVVVGYGTQKKASVIGAISSVAIGDLRAPVAKLSGNIAGQLAGVVSIQRSGEPGAGSTFWIRGISTFGESKTPLILVDGVERDMDLVNVDDIKEMSILKDASATAIYGVRGANGVVMITTRSGDAGKPKVSLSIEGGLVQPTKVPEMLGGVEYAEMYNDATGSMIYSPETIAKYASGVDPDLYPNVNWVDTLYKDYSWNEKVNVSVSGGGDIAKYYISGSFYNEDGLFAIDNMKNYDTSTYYRRYNFRSNVDVQVFRHTKLNFNLGTSFERRNQPGTAADTIWGYALNTIPIAYPLFYSDGTLAGPANNDGANPYVLLTQTGYRERFDNTATSTVNLNQDFGSWITPGLSANIKFAFDAMNRQDVNRTKTPQQWMASSRDEDGNLIKTETVAGQESLTLGKASYSRRTVYLEGSINYARTFGRHSVGALFLYQHSQKNYVNSGESDPDKFLPYRNQGIAGRLTYDFDNRYFVEANFGYNGSENFSPGNRFGFFPSVAVGWALSEEKFFEPAKDVIDMLKFKASYGLVGNDQIGGGRRFIYLETIENGYNYSFGSSNTEYTGIRLGDYPNPNVGWETVRKLNVGVDLSLFGKLKIQADYFDENRSGIFLQSSSIPEIAGLVNKPWINVGRMHNRGVDASLDYHQKFGQVEVTARANFTYTHNTILNNDQPDWEYLYLNRIGQSNWQTFGLVADGLFQSQEEIDAWPTQKFGEVKPGDIRYLDINGDGVVDDYDKKPIGFPNVPEISYGFGASVRWKGFDVSVFFQGVDNVNFFINNTYTQGFTANKTRHSNVFADLYGNYWTENNRDAKYPRLTIGQNTNNNQTSTYWMVNGRYLRLKNAEIGYTLPKRILSKAHIDRLRIYVSGVNLLTFSPFKLWDPDLQTGAAGYPNNRVYNLGVTLVF